MASSAVDAQPETTRVLRLDLGGIESSSNVVCDLAIRHRTSNTARFLPHGYYRRVLLLTTNTLSRLEVRAFPVMSRPTTPTQQPQTINQPSKALHFAGLFFAV